jgi:hypothetical protein
VRHDHSGDAALAGRADQPHNPLSIGRVEGSGRLVGQKDVPVADHGPGDRDPLTFATGQLVRKAPGPLPQAELLQRPQAEGPGRPPGRAVEFQWQGDVLGGGEPGEEIEILEHEADRPTSEPGLVVAGHSRERRTGDEHLAMAGLFEAASDREQRALARAARSHDGHQLAVVNRQIDFLEGAHLGRPLAVHLRNVL